MAALVILNHASTKYIVTEMEEKVAHAKRVAEMAEVEYLTMNAHYIKKTEEMLQLKRQLLIIDGQIPPRYSYDSPQAKKKRLNAIKKASYERLNLLGLSNRRTEADRRQDALDDAEAVRLMSSLDAAAWLANKKAERASVARAQATETAKLVNKIYQVLNTLE
jgi:hypothetical protein